MANNLKFSNEILMFKEENRGFRRDKPPAGYVRLEVRDGKGKITAMVQNLKDIDEYNNYKLYLIKYDEKEICPALMGEILVKNGRGKITREFNPFNVEDTKLHINDFNIGAVILERIGNGRADIKCPLVSYKGKQLRWIEAFEKHLEAKVKSDEKAEENKDYNKINDIREESREKRTYKVTQEDKTVNIQEDTVVAAEEAIREATEKVIEEDTKEVTKETIEDDTGRKTETEIDDFKTMQDVGIDIYSKYIGGVESKYSFTENIPEKNPDAMCTNCIEQYRNVIDEGINKEYENKEIKKQKKEETPPDIDLLVNCLDKVFKRCDPFNTRRRDYKWWKIHSPVYLSNVLQYCNIHIPKIFNPSIIMAYYKYRYLIAGIYTSRKKSKEYIVYGIPGTYKIDESPLGDLCRWIQVEGNTHKYGAFGYWIAYIDPATGKLLKVG